jgi:hypothetical protein
MPLSKCPRCKQLWNRDHDAIVCEACAPDEDADREKVLEFIANNPGQNTDAIAEATEVDVETIRRMLDEGVIAREADLGAAICGQCGAPAISHTQQLCDACLGKLEKETLDRRRSLQSAIQQTKASAGGAPQKAPSQEPNAASAGGQGGAGMSTRKVLQQKRQ